MTRPVWSGSIAVGLITAPVRAYTARTPDHTIRYTTHDVVDGSPIANRRTNKATGAEVPAHQIQRRTTAPNGTTVTVTDADLAAVADPAGDKTVALDGFAPAAAVDPRAWGKAYDLLPDTGGDRAYTLLTAALATTNRAGIGVWHYRQHRRLVMVAAGAAGGLTLRELAWPDEMADNPAVPTVPTVDRELDAAVALVEALAVPWRHADWIDERHCRTLDMLDDLAAGRAPTTTATPAAPADAADDIMAVLLASIAATRAAA